MGKLSSLLKRKKPSIKKRSKSKITRELNSESNELIGTLSPENYEKVKSSVVEIDTTDKDRRSIIIGMFGSIKNPITGKRFTIPNLSHSDDDYVYQYAKYMKTLVYRPDEFTKIMNWE